MKNFDRLLKVFQEMGYDIDEFPRNVLEKRQNITINFPPLDLNLELITNFSINKSFEETYEQAEIVAAAKEQKTKWHVIPFMI